MPTWHNIVARIAPMLGMFPVTSNVDQIEAALSIPMSPPVGAGARALGPNNDPGDPLITARAARQEKEAAKAAHAAAPHGQHVADAVAPAASLRRDVSYVRPSG